MAPRRKPQKDSDADAMAGAPGEAVPGSDEPVMQFYAANGKRVKADDDSAVRQYLSDDPNRPDASDEERDDANAGMRLDPSNEPPKLLYYDADGNPVSEPVSGGRQYTAEDANRPDADGAAPKTRSRAASTKTEPPKLDEPGDLYEADDETLAEQAQHYGVDVGDLSGYDLADAILTAAGYDPVNFRPADDDDADADADAAKAQADADAQAEADAKAKAAAADKSRKSSTNK